MATIQQPVLTRGQILRILREHDTELRQFAVRRIGLFGSYAKDTPGDDSDIDFLVDFERPTYDNFYNLIVYLEALFGKRVEVLTPDALDSIRVEEVAAASARASFMPRRGDVPALKDIVEAIDRIQRYVGDMPLSEFLANTEKQDAVVRNLEIIGEAVKSLSAELREQYANVEWTKIAAMRDRLVHHYFGVNWVILWDVVQERLSPLKAAVEQILAGIDG